MNAPTDTCVFVSNATIGINTVLRNLVYKPKEVIIYFATIYGACEKTINYLTETTGVESRKIEYTYPVSDEYLCEAFEATVKELKAKGKTPKVTIFDTIAALPGVRMPFERLTRLCKQENILSCIDGAHGVGHIPLDLSELDPDFFVSNCHKWLYTPRGCALFYVPKRNQHLMRSTLPTSHGFVPLPSEQGQINNPLPPSEKGEFVNNFEFVGTLDSSPYLCVPAALQWRSKLSWNGKAGEEAVVGYSQHLARRSGEIVSRILGTESLKNDGSCNFSNIRLPLSFSALTNNNQTQATEIGQWIVKVLVEEYGTFVAIVFFGGAWWVRLSAQVYLTEQDFEWAGQVLNEVCTRVRDGQWRSASRASRL